MKKTKFKYIWLSVAFLVLCLLALPLFAGLKNTKTCALSTDFESENMNGIGTQIDPYQIEDAEQLMSLSLASIGNKTTEGKTFEGQYFKLMNNIDLSSYCVKPEKQEGFRGIGCEKSPFAGIFDGNEKTVKIEMHATAVNTTEERYANIDNKSVGFFNVLKGATIKNLNVEGYVALGNLNDDEAYVGGLFGRAIELSPTISNVKVACEVTNDGRKDATAYVGGLGGFVSVNYDENNKDKVDVLITDIEFGASVSSTAQTSYVGGILGFATMKKNEADKPERCIMKLDNIKIKSGSAVSSASYVGAVIGSVRQFLYTIVSDVVIEDIDLQALIPNCYKGVVCGLIETNGKLVVVNCVANKNLPANLVDARGVGKDRLVTMKATQIANQDFNNMEIGEKIDLRDVIEENVSIHEEEENYLIACSIKHTEDKGLTVDFNTKLVVQNAGNSVVVLDVIYDKISVYQMEFEVKVALAWSPFVKIVIIGAILVGLFLIYKFLVLRLLNKSASGSGVNRSAVVGGTAEIQDKKETIHKEQTAKEKISENGGENKNAKMQK